MNTYGVDLMGRRRRRRHSADFKAAVIQKCGKPGVSMARRRPGTRTERHHGAQIGGQSREQDGAEPAMVEAAVPPPVDAGFVPLALAAAPCVALPRRRG
jgi:hypothetical protein